MPFQVLPDSSRRFLEIRYAGNVTPVELRSAFAEGFRVAAELDTFLVLTDCVGMQGGHSLFDLYAMVADLAGHQEVVRYKEAVLMPAAPDLAEKVTFWETACRNRGLWVKVFSDRGSALAWLLG